jgi:hypothetical protein
MPYISQEERRRLALQEAQPDDAGSLNYMFTSIITQYLKYNGLRYQTINDIVGALEGAKLEFYRRIAVPYEDTKIKANGDVYLSE